MHEFFFWNSLDISGFLFLIISIWTWISTKNSYFHSSFCLQKSHSLDESKFKWSTWGYQSCSITEYFQNPISFMPSTYFRHESKQKICFENKSMVIIFIIINNPHLCESSFTIKLSSVFLVFLCAFREAFFWYVTSCMQVWFHIRNFEIPSLNSLQSLQTWKFDWIYEWIKCKLYIVSYI